MWNSPGNKAKSWSTLYKKSIKQSKYLSDRLLHEVQSFQSFPIVETCVIHTVPWWNRTEYRPVSNHLYWRLLCSFVVLTPAADEQIRLVFFFLLLFPISRWQTVCNTQFQSVQNRQRRRWRKKRVRERRGARDKAMELLSSPASFWCSLHRERPRQIKRGRQIEIVSLVRGEETLWRRADVTGNRETEVAAAFILYAAWLQTLAFPSPVQNRTREELFLIVVSIGVRYLQVRRMARGWAGELFPILVWARIILPLFCQQLKEFQQPIFFCCCRPYSLCLLSQMANFCLMFCAVWTVEAAK